VQRRILVVDAGHGDENSGYKREGAGLGHKATHTRGGCRVG